MFFVFFAANTNAQTFTKLAGFGGANGWDPQSSMIQGADGSFYGTTQFGGNLSLCQSYGCGTIFKITPSGVLTAIYRFSDSDGAGPAALVQGTDGNFYGTTWTGGSNLYGTVFKLTPSGSLTTLHNFSPTEGALPYVLIRGNDGNFYGANEAGGASNQGTIFKITSSGALTTLHTFTGSEGDGPNTLLQAPDGNFYGTASSGGTHPCGSGTCGTVFKMTPDGTLTVLHEFDGTDGEDPDGLVQGTDGNFYGTTALGGAHHNCLDDTCGTAFMMTPSGALTTLYNFAGTDGAQPRPGLLQATDGNFYGTTVVGGQFGVGSAFRLTPTGTLFTLHSFCSGTGCPDGEQPLGGLVQGTSGLLYGTASMGGAHCVISVTGCGTVFSLSGVNPTASQFVPLTPCRLVDTRSGNGPIQSGTFAFFNLVQLSQGSGCGDLSSATSYSLNVTLIPENGAPVSYLTIWPAGRMQPLVSTMNSLDGRTKANAAIAPAGASGAVSVFVTNAANVVIDIDGYFAPPSAQTLQFYALPPCRVADTRNASFPQGLGTPHLSQGVARDFPVLSSPCIPQNLNAAAYSFNFTAIPYPSLGHALAYLEVWPTDQQPQHPVSTLNNPTATYVANAAIVPAGTDGKFTAFASDDTDLAIDINGYFAAPGTGGLSLYPTVPCRVFDTRKVGNGQPFTGTLSPPIDVVDSPCGVPNTAQAYVFNTTAVPSGNLSYLTLWPDSQDQPVVSTLNAADGLVTSNMAIVPSVNGKIDAYAAGLTQLILDISSYFAP